MVNWEECGRELSWPILMQSPRVLLELRETGRIVFWSRFEIKLLAILLDDNFHVFYCAHVITRINKIN
jgi:hypothetical protein